MSDDLVKDLRGLEAWIKNPQLSPMTLSYDIFDRAADRIEKLEAEEIDFDRVIGNYASENALFRDHIKKLEAALREIAGNGNATGCNPQIMCDAARKALDAE